MNTEKLRELFFKSYADATVIYRERAGVLDIYFDPQELAPEWKQKYISAFSGRITELILSDPETEEGVAKHQEIIKNHVVFMNNYYNENCEPHRRFYESVEEARQDYKGIDNLKIIVNDDNPDEMFVNLINVKDVERWRLNKFDESDRIWDQFDELMAEDY